MIAFVDGSYKDGKVGWGYALISSAGYIHHQACGKVTKPYALPSRNVAGELAATMRAVRKAIELGRKKLRIVHDYSGIKCWVTGEWKAKLPITQDYRERMLAFKEEIELEFIQVHGHSGVQGNEIANSLARKAIGA